MAHSRKITPAVSKRPMEMVARSKFLYKLTIARNNVLFKYVGKLIAISNDLKYSHFVVIKLKKPKLKKQRKIEILTYHENFFRN